MSKHKQTGIECLIQILQALSTCDCAGIEGTISLNMGHHEVSVTTEITPKNVFLSVKPLGTPVCVGNIDMVGYSIIPGGFVLYADIKSSAAEVSYFVD